MVCRLSTLAWVLMVWSTVAWGAEEQKERAARRPLREAAAAERTPENRDAVPGRAAASRFAERLKEAISPSQKRSATVERRRMVIPLKHSPALDVANTIRQFLQSEFTVASAAKAESPEDTVTLVPDKMTNSLIVGASPKALDALQPLIAELDRPRPMVAIRTVIAEVAAGEERKKSSRAEQAETQVSVTIEKPDTILQHLAQRGKLELVARPEIMTLDNQPAFLQVGQRISLADKSDQAKLQNTGLILGVTPRVNGDGCVVMEIDLEKSEPSQDRRSIRVTTVQTTLTVKNQETAIVGRLVHEAEDGGSELVMLVTAEVIPAGK